MTVARFAIAHAGPQVTVQDTGRPGLMRFGVPRSGPMDRFAYQIANQALGNAPGTPTIEVSLGGLTLRCLEGQTSFTVAGGSFQVSLGEQSLGPWAVASIKAGETLTLRPGRWGSWCYLAFAGDMQAQNWLGSCATHGPSGFGGDALATGGMLQIEDAELRPDRHGGIPVPVSARPRQRIRVVLGPQDRFFDSEAIQTLLSKPYILTDAYDRMGVRLSGPLLMPNATLDMPSEPIVRGSIQVAGDGVATVLLADHQTTGGYPKIATILSDDLDGFVQLRSRNTVRFEAVTPIAATESMRTRSKSYQNYLKHAGFSKSFQQTKDQG